ncbi:unnamed protein product [Paramecium octaurelia]|uniref:RRM domain-containing protein n=1 Tax=Paramecium octaurelia TaxID=43137 RepID=A0A8S1RZ22_PAROT|nr:unnamed protein product [Paramecium octaurelia]
MLQGLNVPPLFSINREEILKPVQQAQVEQVPTKQTVEVKEIDLNPPNKTLYINRLNEKVTAEEMRQTLYALFSQSGKVLDIIVKKNILMRGQAFILMEDEESAIQAQKKFHNTQLYDKVMKVNFAKEKSYYISKGEYEEKEKLPMSDKIKEHKKRIQDKRQREMFNQKQQREAPTISMPLTVNQVYTGNSSKIKVLLYNQFFDSKLTKQRLHLVDFVNLEQHFRNFFGFREFRGIKPKGVAFVEFEDELQATHCLNELNGTQFEEVTLQISYQKK